MPPIPNPAAAPAQDQPGPAHLAPAPMVDSDHPAVQAFARAHAVGEDDRARAVALYDAVRDGFRYDPYRCEMTVDGMKASTVLALGAGWCVPKAALLTAACRAAGIPARLGFADVRNHLSTERMRESMKTDVFYWHGFSEIWLDGAWRKATPAFNLTLCQRFRIKPLAFDGRDDSIYHPFDEDGRRHMEYLRLRGSFDDVPLAAMLADFRRHYPRWMSELGDGPSAPAESPGGAPADSGLPDFMADVERETGPAPAP